MQITISAVRSRRDVPRAAVVAAGGRWGMLKLPEGLLKHEKNSSGFFE
jgi:hypothetical protein